MEFWMGSGLSENKWYIKMEKWGDNISKGHLGLRYNRTSEWKDKIRQGYFRNYQRVPFCS